MGQKLKLLRKINDGKYSVYENPDKELAEKIKNYPKPVEFRCLKLGFDPDIPKVRIKEYVTPTKVLVVNDDLDMVTISLDDLERYVYTEHMETINTVFKVSDTFNKYFAPYEINNGIIVKMNDEFMKGYELGDMKIKHSFYTGVNGIFNTKRFEFEEKDNWIFFKVENWDEMGHMYFNENGEIVNRDYNRNFNEKQIQKTKKECIEIIVNKFRDCGNFEYHDNVWYNPEYCIKLSQTENSIHVEKIPLGKKGYYYDEDYPKYKLKKQKSAVPVDDTLFTLALTQAINLIDK
jgi:hypothetical protein